MQWVVGYRLIGEFALQWTLTIAGVVMAFHIAVRLSRSVAASLIAMLPAVLTLATPTVHNSKLFIYPCAILLMWRYIERPGIGRAAVLGVFSAVAFLFRHDHGVYVGAGVLLTFVLARVAHPASRRLHSVASELAACALAAAVLVVPWAIVVQQSEGLVAYVQARAFINSKWSVHRSVFLAILDMNPVRALTREAPSWLPGRDNAQAWLFQVSVLTSLLILAIGSLALVRSLRRKERIALDTCRLLLAGAIVALVQRQLFREAGYFVIVAPAFGARLLAGRVRSEAGESSVPESARRILHLGGRVLAIGIYAISVVAVGGFIRESKFFEPRYLLEHLPRTFARLVASPPIDGLAAGDAARRIDRATWLALGAGDRSDLMVRYMHDCAAPGDRVLVSGQTPYQISYYVDAPIAGGHLYWHDKWRADPARERQSLELLLRQSVPFAFSTHDPVLDDLKTYPDIRSHVAGHYIEIDGSNGHLLVDSRRQPIRAFGMLGFPCFR
jgi:hypothetical protein